MEGGGATKCQYGGSSSSSSNNSSSSSSNSSSGRVLLGVPVCVTYREEGGDRERQSESPQAKGWAAWGGTGLFEYLMGCVDANVKAEGLYSSLLAHKIQKMFKTLKISDDFVVSLPVLFVECVQAEG